MAIHSLPSSHHYSRVCVCVCMRARMCGSTHGPAPPGTCLPTLLWYVLRRGKFYSHVPCPTRHSGVTSRDCRLSPRLPLSGSLATQWPSRMWVHARSLDNTTILLTVLKMAPNGGRREIEKIHTHMHTLTILCIDTTRPRTVPVRSVGTCIGFGLFNNFKFMEMHTWAREALCTQHGSPAAREIRRSGTSLSPPVHRRMHDSIIVGAESTCHQHHQHPITASPWLKGRDSSVPEVDKKLPSRAHTYTHTYGDKSALSPQQHGNRNEANVLTGAFWVAFGFGLAGTGRWTGWQVTSTDESASPILTFAWKPAATPH